MNKIKNSIILILVSILSCITVSFGAYLYGRHLQKQDQTPEDNKTITSQIILEKITDNLFLVTKTVYLNQETTILIESDSQWSNLLWGQEITASGLIRNDLGIDINQLNQNNVEIDESTQTITIYVPDISILDSSLFGDLKIETKKGLFQNIKDLFQSDKSQDYNLATNELINQAVEVISSDQELLDEARKDSHTFLINILQETGYTINVQTIQEESLL